MTAIPGVGFFNGAITNQQAKDAQDQVLAVLREGVGGAPIASYTIAGGVITPAVAAFGVDTEAAADSDDLTNILLTNHPDGRLLLVRSVDAGRVVSVQHAAGGAGQIFLAGAAAVALVDPSMWLLLLVSGTSLVEVGRFYGAARSEARAFLGTETLVTVMSATGTFAKDPRARWVEVGLQGPGAAGGSTAATGAGQAACASGGGAGEYAWARFAAALVDDEITVTLPAGGLAGAPGNNPGNAPSGVAAFGALMTAAAGAPGLGSPAVSTDTTVAGGAAGAGGTGATVAIPGRRGRSAMVVGSSFVPINYGGDAVLGVGGFGLEAGDATGAGAGGGGARANQNAPARAGGRGGDAQAIIKQEL